VPTPTITWAVNADGTWTTAADWNPARVPITSDDVSINTADFHTITHSSGNEGVNSLTVGNDNFVVSGGVLTIATTASFANQLTVSGGTLAISLGGSATVASFAQSGGVVSGRGGHLTVTGPAVFTSTSELSGSGTTLLEGATTLANGSVLNLANSRSISLTGAGSTLAGAINGTGGVNFAGGTQTLDPGFSLGTLSWDISAGATTLNEDLSFAGGFLLTGGTLNVGGFTFTLTGNVALGFPGVGSTGVVTGSGALTLVNGALIAGVTIGGTETVTNSGTAVEQVNPLRLGDSATSRTTFVNEAGAQYDLTDNHGIHHGSPLPQMFDNAGTLAKTGGAGLSKIVVRVVNDGTVSVATGTLEFVRTVTGAGAATIAGGTLKLDGGFVQNVDFTGSSGVLDLAQSQGYSGTVAGFSTGGATEFDLRDIAFVGPGEASFSGTASGGTLTVSDGTNAAAIQLAGNYLSAKFRVHADGHGGTIVTATTGAAAAPALGAAHHRFIAAMAGFAPQPATASLAGGDHAWQNRSMLALPGRHPYA